DCPILFHAHSRPGKLYARQLIGRALRTTRAAVIAVSEFVAQAYPSAQVIYNGVCDLARTRIGKSGPLRVGIVGRIAPEKGHIDFVRAARQINGAEFLIYGEPIFGEPAYTRAVRALAETAPVQFR